MGYIKGRGCMPVTMLPDCTAKSHKRAINMAGTQALIDTMQA